jgi:hypothetical protein
VGIRLAGTGALIGAPFLRRHRDGVTAELRVQPRARRNALEPSGVVLKVAVTAPAEAGKANDAVIALLAKSWRLPRPAFTIIKGAAAPAKTVSVAGEPAMLAGRIEEWMSTHG